MEAQELPKECINSGYGLDDIVHWGEEIICMYGHHIAEYGSTGYGCQSRSWSAEQRKCFFPVPFAPENLISRDRFGCPVPRQPVRSPHSIKLNLVLTRGIPRAFRDGVHIFIPSTAIGSIPILSGHAMAYQWRSMARVHRRKVKSPEGSSSNGCPFFRYYGHELIFCAPFFFPHPPLV